MTPKKATIRRLFALSGNQCAYPGCEHPLLNDKGQLIAQVCHIRAAAEGGERYDPSQNDEERSAADNLLILCYRHHVETNDVVEFSVDRMLDMKLNHERQFSSGSFRVSDVAIEAAQVAMHRLQLSLVAAAVDHPVPELAIDLDATAPFEEVVDRMRHALASLEAYRQFIRESDEQAPADLRRLLKRAGLDPEAFESVPHYKNPFINRHWDVTIIGAANLLTDCDVLLTQLEVQHYTLVTSTTSSGAAVKRLEDAKARLIATASNGGYID